MPSLKVAKESDKSDELKCNDSWGVVANPEASSVILYKEVLKGERDADGIT